GRGEWRWINKQPVDVSIDTDGSVPGVPPCLKRVWVDVCNGQEDTVKRAACEKCRQWLCNGCLRPGGCSAPHTLSCALEKNKEMSQAQLGSPFVQQTFKVLRCH
ncbi:unnamed protein product, partial [Gadus morhua 'NCC']